MILLERCPDIKSHEALDGNAATFLYQAVKKVLVKLGANGSALFIEGEDPIVQPIIPASEVLDTTGAGDTFTAAFAVALVECKPMKECLKFAGTEKQNSYCMVLMSS